jgi:hypothetical protein
MLPLTRAWIEDYRTWLAELANAPPPDLQALVARHGRFDLIQIEAWAEFDRAMAKWHADRRHWLLAASIARQWAV